MRGLENIVGSHPFFAGMDEGFRDVVTGCAKNVQFAAGQFIFRQGEPAEQFYLIRHGRVALQISSPGRGALTFQTIGEGEIFGISWLIPPYRWTCDAKALELTRAIALDGVCLRRKADADHDLGYELMKRFMPVILQRLEATRMQILDVYGAHA